MHIGKPLVFAPINICLFFLCCFFSAHLSPFFPPCFQLYECFLSPYTGQQRSQRSQARSSSRLKIKNVIREDDGSRIQCLSCEYTMQRHVLTSSSNDVHLLLRAGSSDFTSKSLDITDSCYNPNSVSIDKVKHSLITLCPPESLFCKVEINRVGGVFAGISRSCGGNYCVEACKLKLYLLFM